ncbi:uncharacterized protein LOC105174858 [Sesamum indicum]|uniref:Uncharacterized protein LOC105174858 n=1 Tax=Sesamum indicum TaxID=4182 RepID=A0A6I9UBV6_SESIN|nr:uncharacterized protein LOC105174858 [Sesamum indicum]XP_011095384.1 uncharacterized protein LOC105174858 [Sesamum indicum]XP_011095385.1 uncharacterized protein LOC105174858 [Sesamum indicum]XP_020554005.1 uncharacterized protein LOC105174858 [Sesamum indicum]
MNIVTQEESSAGPSVQPAKRRRGRPRKDASPRHTEAAHLPPGFQGVKEYLPQKADRTMEVECLVGQAVTGVVEATFDAGYLLNVRIGNSNTNLRGVVFKPGHYVPITAENDVAPHVQMVRRNDLHFTAENLSSSRGKKLTLQTTAMVPSKRKYAPPKTAPPAPPVGLRGRTVPMIPQPVDSPSELQASDYDDKDVHMAEPLSMLPPNQSIPVGLTSLAAQPHPSHQVAPGSKQDNDGSFDKSISEVGQEEVPKPMTSTDIDTSGSSQASDIKIEVGKEELISSAEDSGIISKQEIEYNTTEPLLTEALQATASIMEPLFYHGTGRMTELLQALQENMKETPGELAEPPSSAAEIESLETAAIETDPENEASLP